MNLIILLSLTEEAATTSEVTIEMIALTTALESYSKTFSRLSLTVRHQVTI